MTDLIETGGWVDGVYQIEMTDPVVGGPPDVDNGAGIANVQAQQLAQRTAFLKAVIDELGDASGFDVSLDVNLNVDGALLVTRAAIRAAIAAAVNGLSPNNSPSFTNGISIGANHVGDGGNDYGVILTAWEPALTFIDRSDGAGSTMIRSHADGSLWFMSDRLNDGTIGHATNTTDFSIARLQRNLHRFYTSDGAVVMLEINSAGLEVNSKLMIPAVAGSAGQILTMNGSGSAAGWEDLPAFGSSADYDVSTNSNLGVDGALLTTRAVIAAAIAQVNDALGNASGYGVSINSDLEVSGSLLTTRAVIDAAINAAIAAEIDALGNASGYDVSSNSDLNVLGDRLGTRASIRVAIAAAIDDLGSASGYGVSINSDLEVSSSLLTTRAVIDAAINAAIDSIEALPLSGGTLTGNLEMFRSSADAVLTIRSRGSGDMDAFLVLDSADTGESEISFRRDGVTLARITLEEDGDLNFDAPTDMQLNTSGLTINGKTAIPAAMGGAGQVLTVNPSGSGVGYADLPDGTPTGAVIYHAGNTAPDGFLKANGANLNRSTYAALFGVIGTTFGGSGSSFRIPDLRGEFVRGWDDARGIDGGRSFGSWQDDAFQSHSHQLKKSGTGGGSGAQNGPHDGGYMNTTAVGGTETRPRNMALLACIKF
jgi:microcystin-dependent protein